MSKILFSRSTTDLNYPNCRPSLDLDFTQEVLDERITFIRGTTGTRVNRNRLIESVPVNQPRFDYDPITGECRGLLIEESRQNLLPNSIPQSGIWSSVNCSITANSEIAPDGTQTASLIRSDLTHASRYINLNTSITSGTTYTQTFFVKAGTTRFVQVAPSTGFSSERVNFELTGDGVIGTSTVQSASIQRFPNGWYRISVTQPGTTTTGAGRMLLVLVTSLTSGRLSASPISSCYVWGAQLEEGAFPTSYIPTGGSTVTRSPELAEMTGTNFSNWYNQKEGTFFFDGTLPFITNDNISSGARVPFGVSNGFSFANSMYVAKGNTSLDLFFTVVNNSVGQSSSLASTMTSNRFKISTAFADRNIYSCGYGGTVNKSIISSASIPTVSRLTLGKEPWNTGFSNSIIGHITRFTYYPRALNPSQLQYLTQ